MILYTLRGRVPQKKKFQLYIDRILEDLFADKPVDYVYVNIHFKPQCEGEAAGFCYESDDDEITVEVAKSSMNEPYTVEEIARNLAHELVHVRQHIEGTACIDHHLPYADRPSEQEAYALERVLREKHWYK